MVLWNVAIAFLWRPIGILFDLDLPDCVCHLLHVADGAERSFLSVDRTWLSLVRARVSISSHWHFDRPVEVLPLRHVVQVIALTGSDVELLVPPICHRQMLPW